jgi:phage N-6-adenine-methyltransferase
MESNVHFSSQSEDWPTPVAYFRRLSRLFNLTLDPSASPSNAKCAAYFTAETDGLLQSWQTQGAVFMNPPYGRTIGRWVKKAYEESQRGTPVVCLLPARPDTAWWNDYCTKGIIRFVRGRLNSGTPGTAPHSQAPSSSSPTSTAPNRRQTMPTYSPLRGCAALHFLGRAGRVDKFSE